MERLAKYGKPLFNAITIIGINKLKISITALELN